MKYVIVEELGIELPIIFNEILDHSSVARDRKVVSAGHVKFGCGIDGSMVVSCYGKSVTLRTKSRGTIDEEIIKKTNEDY